MRIIEIQAGERSREVVAGLIWHPLQSSGSARAKEILIYAQATGADLKVMRGSDSAHVGLAKKVDGAKAGQIAAAAVIADALAGEGHRNVLVAMPLPDERATYVFVSVRDGVILADGDTVGTEEEIRVRLVGDVAYGGWDAMICPDEWAVLGAQEREFNSFFTPEVLRKPNRWRLGETKLAWRKALVPVVLVAALGMGAFSGWSFWQKKKAADALALRLQQEEAERGQRASPAEPPKPWPLIPDPQTFSRACALALGRVGLTGGNWKLDGAACQGGLLTVRWSKPNENAWISHLKLVRPDAEISSDGMSASVTVPATAASANDFATVLPSVNGTSLRYFDLASRYGLGMVIEPPQAPQPPPTLPGQTAGNASPVALSWIAMPLRVVTTLDPADVAAILDYPGLRFTKIAYVFNAGAIQFQLTGVQYVRP